MCDFFATSESNVFRAVYPAGSKTAPATAINKIDVLLNPKVVATIGNAATESEDSKSAPMLTARRPKWSTIHPPIGETRIAGKAEIAATKPANAGESVRSRINHGIVIITIEFPSAEAKLET
jgi:hypothetical protein